MLTGPEAGGAPNMEAEVLRKAIKHHWFGDTAPWSEQRVEDEYGFEEQRSRPAPKAVILDQENPTQPRSDRAVEI